MIPIPDTGNPNGIQGTRGWGLGIWRDDGGDSQFEEGFRFRFSRKGVRGSGFWRDLIHNHSQSHVQSSIRWCSVTCTPPSTVASRKSFSGHLPIVFNVSDLSTETKISQAAGGAESRVRLNPRDAIKTKKAIFHEFGLNVDDYHRHLRAAVDYNEVPDTARHHIAVAFLTDFVDYCGEYQPDDESWHLDSMDIKEIWEDYARDETVVRLTNLDRGANELLSQKELTKLWTCAFYKVHIRYWKGITGHDLLAVHVLCLSPPASVPPSRQASAPSASR